DLEGVRIDETARQVSELPAWADAVLSQHHSDDVAIPLIRRRRLDIVRKSLESAYESTERIEILPSLIKVLAALEEYCTESDLDMAEDTLIYQHQTLHCIEIYSRHNPADGKTHEELFWQRYVKARAKLGYDTLSWQGEKQRHERIWYFQK